MHSGSYIHHTKIDGNRFLLFFYTTSFTVAVGSWALQISQLIGNADNSQQNYFFQSYPVEVKFREITEEE